MSAAVKLSVPRERPILFSAPMVRAILAGRKTQTRRVVSPQPVCGDVYYEKYCPLHGALPQSCRYGVVGDRLWVRETWQQVIGRRVSSEEAWWPGKQEWPGVPRGRPSIRSRTNSTARIIWRADGEFPGGFPERWRPSIFMPRWASRITLEVTDVRVERLQDISEEDAKAEGVEAAPFCKSGRPNGLEHVEAYEGLWDSINAKRGLGWTTNPWVWVLTFKPEVANG